MSPAAATMVYGRYDTAEPESACAATPTKGGVNGVSREALVYHLGEEVRWASGDKHVRDSFQHFVDEAGWQEPAPA